MVTRMNEDIYDTYLTRDQILCFTAVGGIHKSHPAAFCFIPSVNYQVETAAVEDLKEVEESEIMSESRS